MGVQRIIDVSCPFEHVPYVATIRWRLLLGVQLPFKEMWNMYITIGTLYMVIIKARRMHMRATVVCVSVCYHSSASARCVCDNLNLPSMSSLNSKGLYKMQISLKHFLSQVTACFSLSHGQGGHFQSWKLPHGKFN